MQHTKQSHRWSLSIRNQIAILSAIVGGLVIATFTLYDFMNFLRGIRVGDPFALALLVSIMGSGFVLLHKLGFSFTYKDEIELADDRKDSSVPSS